jgi:hypothetical protein
MKKIKSGKVLEQLSLKQIIRWNAWTKFIISKGTNSNKNFFSRIQKISIKLKN